MLYINNIIIIIIIIRKVKKKILFIISTHIAPWEHAIIRGVSSIIYPYQKLYIPYSPWPPAFVQKQGPIYIILLVLLLTCIHT